MKAEERLEWWSQQAKKCQLSTKAETDKGLILPRAPAGVHTLALAEDTGF